MPQDDLHSLADAVTDERSFIAFLKALSDDRADEVAKDKVSPSSPYGPGANGWENGSIEAFLERAAAWAEDTFDRPQDFPRPTNPWTLCAKILVMGKYYE